MADPYTVTNGSFTKTYYTVTTLPAAASMQGGVEWVTDANSNAAVDPGEVVVGGGTTYARVLSDGTNWRLFGNRII
jgi:hypothetical protein